LQTAKSVESSMPCISGLLHGNTEREACDERKHNFFWPYCPRKPDCKFPHSYNIADGYAEQEEYDKSGKPLNAAAVRQVQRAKSERKRKRSTVWIAVCMVSLVASFSCIVAVWMWRRRHAEKRESEGGFSYHNPTADLGDRYFSAQHSGSDFGSTPGTGKMMSKSGRGKAPAIMIYDNSYLTTPGETVRSHNDRSMCMLLPEIFAGLTKLFFGSGVVTKARGLQVISTAPSASMNGPADQGPQGLCCAMLLVVWYASGPMLH
jgi:hypothetical protein